MVWVRAFCVCMLRTLKVEEMMNSLPPHQSPVGAATSDAAPHAHPGSFAALAHAQQARLQQTSSRACGIPRERSAVELYELDR